MTANARVRDRRGTPPARPGSRLIPGAFAVLVVGLAGLLLVVGARSPYTHGNLVHEPDPSYARTDQILVGPSAHYRGSRTSVSLAGADEVTRGAAYFVTKGCAGCHGLWGRGGAVGPQIQGADAAWIREIAHEGPGPMPVFASEALPDEVLKAIVAYLRSGVSALPPTK